ncbi:flagellar basal body L-ring protein FlgH [Algirhabdus cladophorae]|uniref:flagellar basal body L-ring protein FlgH n=1 Tax=Algirhabdus cladophorae TaxID=3377108 RepID=UPI003B8481E5
MLKIITLAAVLGVGVSACARIENIGQEPELSPTIANQEHTAMLSPSLPMSTTPDRGLDQSSLWNSDRRSLLGDRRAGQRGDIMTVVIEIDDRAEFSNASERSRSGSESLSVPQLLGLPQQINKDLPVGATMGDAVDLNSNSSSGGDGSVKRREKLTLRVAATVLDVLPNGVLAIQGTQEVRVNFELRELLVTGYVRPEDVSRQNEITYDKIASARISYGGRGQISDVQQPRYGQQVLDILLPF